MRRDEFCEKLTRLENINYEAGGISIENMEEFRKMFKEAREIEREIFLEFDHLNSCLNNAKKLIKSIVSQIKDEGIAL